MGPAAAIKSESWAFSVILGVITALAALAIDIALPAVPTLVRDLGMAPDAAQSTLPVFFLWFALGQLPWGWLSDWIGRRPILLTGAAGYTLASVMSGLANSGEELLFWRAVHGFFTAAAVIMPRAVLRDYFSGTEYAAKMATIMSVFFLTPMLAPQLGTLLLVIGDWRLVFFVPALIGLLCFLAILLMLEESLDTERRRRSSLLGIFNVMIAMGRHRLTGIAIFLSSSMFVGLIGWLTLSPLVLTGPYGVNEKHYAFYFTGVAGTQLIGVILYGRLLKRLNQSAILRIATVLSFIGSLLVLVVTQMKGASHWGIIAGISMFMISFSLIMPTASAVAMDAFGRVGGVASAIIATIQSLVGATGGYAAAKLYDGTGTVLAAALIFASLIGGSAALLLSARLKADLDAAALSTGGAGPS